MNLGREGLRAWSFRALHDTRPSAARMVQDGVLALTAILESPA